VCEIMSEHVIYEDGNYVLKRCVHSADSGFVFDYKLIIKGLKVFSRLYCYESENYGVPTYVVSAVLQYFAEPWRNLNVFRYYRGDDPSFRKLVKYVNGIRAPRDFILLFMDIVSPALADLCREVVKGCKQFLR